MSMLTIVCVDVFAMACGAAASIDVTNKPSPVSRPSCDSAPRRRASWRGPESFCSALPDRVRGKPPSNSASRMAADQVLVAEWLRDANAGAIRQPNSRFEIVGGKEARRRP